MRNLLGSKFPLLIALAYTVPWLFWSITIVTRLEEPLGLWFFSAGFFLLVLGALCTFFISLGIQKEVGAVDAPGLEEENHYLKDEIERLKAIDTLTDEEKQGLEKLQEYQKNTHALQKELDNARNQGMLHLKEKEAQVADLQEQVASLKKIILEKDEILAKLRGKVGDLTHEIKNLVQHTKEDDKEKKEPTHAHEASLILKKSIQLAQGYTGAWSFNPRMSSLGDLSIDSHALDQRRFYQALSKEKDGLVFVFSPKEEKVLYVNSEVKNLLGLSQETFMQHFSKLIEPKYSQFLEVIRSLKEKRELEMPLPFKTGVGKEGHYRCHMAQIGMGLFKHQVLGVIT